jgi:NAD(P)-dependent dehydrogenase (short-subunit alcohol dehydrogenase family)
LAEPSGSGLFRLDGKVALVIGASRGIGEACALELAAAGADVALAARELDRLGDAATGVEAAGRAHSSHTVDVRDLASIERLVPAVLDRHGRIDILVQASGTNVQRAALDVREEDWDTVVDTNLKGAFFCCQAVGRAMVERGSGRIVNIASTFSVVGFPNRAAYAASKGGLVQLTKVLALEWVGRGVNVNAVAPTAIRTVMNEALFRDPDWVAEVLPRIPAGRFATARDVAGAVVYLASPAAAMVNGTVLLVDGGWTAI